MDQIKTALAQAKKFHFWILCSVIAIVGLGSWYMTQASLQKEFTENKTEIDGAYTNADQMLAKSNPPNPVVHEQMNIRIRDLQKSVAEVWRGQYEHQKSTTLAWPSDLTRKFLAAVEPLRPIEEKFNEYPTPPAKEIHLELRQEYANYIEIELPKLAKVIGAKWSAVAPAGEGGFGEGNSAYAEMSSNSFGASPFGAGMGPGGPNGQRAAQEEIVVDWNSSNQSLLMSRFTWTKQPGGAPTTLQVLYAQEDLWVLKSLMEIINKANDGATEKHKAYIKKIEAIQIGRDASGRTGQVARAMAPGAGGSPGEMMGSAAMSSANMGMGAPTDSAAQPTDSAATGSNPMGMGGPMGGGGGDPADRRYVDKDYKPLEGSKLRSDVTSSPTDVYLAVAKRMPVRLVCQIDQRKIHKLLAECGNSPLTVEVRQVRIGENAGKGAQSGSGSFGSMSMGGMGSGSSADFMSNMSSAYSSDSSSDGSSGYGAMMGGGNNAGAASTANDVMVEIYGIVYIYNPVNKKALRIDDTQNASGVTADAGTAKSPS